MSENQCQHCNQDVEFGVTEDGFRGFVHITSGLSRCPSIPEALEPTFHAARLTREWTGRRDDSIRAAVASGASLRAVGEAAGLSHTAVAKIAKR